MEDKKKFAVIFFPAENIHSEVPVSWLTSDLKQCWWPNSVNARNHMIRSDSPDQNTWNLHEVKVEAFASTLESARKKAENPDYATGTEDIVPGKRQRVKKNQYFSSSDDPITPPPSPKGYKKASKKSINKIKVQVNESPVRTINFDEFCQQEVNPQVAISTVSPVVPLTLPSTDAPVIETLSEMDAIVVECKEKADGGQEDIPIIVCRENPTIEDLYFAIQELSITCTLTQRYAASIDKRLKAITLEQGNAAIDNLMEILLEKIPLKTVDEIQSLDMDVNNKQDFRKCYTSYVKQIGGRDVKDNVNRCLPHLFTNQLGTECSYMGQRGNYKLQDFTFMKLLLDIIMLQHKSNKYEVERNVGEWFRLSRQRLKREKKQ